MTESFEAAGTPRETACLPVVRRWLDAMHAREVSYCHFKSNAAVAAGLAGLTDMDVLGDRRRYGETVELLMVAGFKRFKTAALMDYPAVEDYLAFDETSGKFVHLHLHWRMIAGEPYLKGYRLPWEELLLDGRIWDAESGIYVTSREAELVLLLARAVVKRRSRDHLRAVLGRPYFRGDLRREYDWLVERIDHAAAVSLASRLLGEAAAELLGSCLRQGGIVDRDIFALRRAAMPVLQASRTYSWFEARCRRWLREFNSLWGRQVKRWSQPLDLYRRGPVTGGIVVALLGADGSGKSTLRDELVTWLGWKIDVMPLYLGSGDGPSSLPRRLLGLVAAMTRRLRKSPSAPAKSGSQEPPPSLQPLSQAPFRRRLSRCLMALALAYERSSKVRRGFRARNRGMVVIADRFPQTQIMGYNDGPLLDGLSNESAVWRLCARLERRLYDRMVRWQPDLVIKLRLAPEIALDRKPSTPVEMVRLKTEAVARLAFALQTRIVDIDASKPLKDVVLAAKQAVWSEL